MSKTNLIIIAVIILVIIIVMYFAFFRKPKEDTEQHIGTSPGSTTKPSGSGKTKPSASGTGTTVKPPSSVTGTPSTVPTSYAPLSGPRNVYANSIATPVWLDVSDWTPTRLAGDSELLGVTSGEIKKSYIGESYVIIKQTGGGTVYVLASRVKFTK